ncbi:MAG: HAD-IIIA family hydrolase [Acidobacteriota bacterium]
MDNHNSPRPAVFLDRDGVITREVGYVTHIDQLTLLPNVVKALSLLEQNNYLRIVLTNQSAVARGMMTEETLNDLHRYLLSTLLPREDLITDIYYCPHFPPREGPESPPYLISCSCRKPEPGLIITACDKYDIDLPYSYLIGDRASDIELGYRAGLTTMLARSGYSMQEYDWYSGIRPDFIFDDLGQAVDFIIHSPSKYEYIEQKVFSGFNKFPEQRMIVVVGGQSRSGKSTLVNYLLRQARLNAIPAMTVKLDNWIVPAAERTPEMNVLDRYCMPQLEADIAVLLNGGNVVVSSYETMSRGNRRIPLDLRIPSTGIVLIEGVPALASEYLRSLSNINVYVNTDIHIHKDRFFKFYSGKGLSFEEVEALYQQRMIDEFPIIDDTRQYGDILL